ncbi:MAG: hypothetical protein JWR88_1125 [Pseudonocardia sp.]|nr:hypothetical protein [Pseudonocardia sp.]
MSGTVVGIVPPAPVPTAMHLMADAGLCAPSGDRRARLRRNATGGIDTVLVTARGRSQSLRITRPELFAAE